MIWTEFDVDVSAAAGLGEPLQTRVTACLPAPAELGESPTVCFAFPGAGFGRRYFMFDLPGDAPGASGGQAGWHARRGWIVFAVDHLGVGDSSLPEPTKLGFAVVSAANQAAVGEALRRLAAGELADGYPAVAAGAVLGLGQSMGGALVIHQQAHHRAFDAIAVLGFSAIHTTAKVPPGTRPAPIPFLTRDAGLADTSPESRRAAAVNAQVLELSEGAHYPTTAAPPPGWDYHFDDEPAAVVARDLGLSGERAPWRSATMPGLVHHVTAPGVVAAEAAAICVPVLAAFGERDVAEDPRLEAKAYRHAVDFSLFICPRMAHMHNFAGTRDVLWARIDQWGRHVAELKRRLPERWPSGLYSDSY